MYRSMFNFRSRIFLSLVYFYLLKKKKKKKTSTRNHFNLTWDEQNLFLLGLLNCYLKDFIFLKFAYSLICISIKFAYAAVLSHSACQPPLSMGILQARILEWIAMSSSRGSFQPRNGTRSPTLQAGSLLTESPEAPFFHLGLAKVARYITMI